MAQPSVGTPIQLYSSATSGNVPVASNLAQGELAINVADGKLYYKTSGGTVGTLANAAVATGNLPGGSTGTVVYQSATGVTAYLTLGASGYILTSNGTGPAYINPASLTVGTAATAGFATNAGNASTATLATSSTNVAGGTANQLVYQSAVGTTAFATAPTTTGTVLGWTGSAFAWVLAPAATTATSIAGGAQYQIPFQSAVSTTAFSSNLTFNSSTNTFTATNITGTSITGTSVSGGTITATASVSAASNVGAINYGTLNFTDTNIVASYQASVNSYFQEVIQNTNSGNQASAEFVAYNNSGTATTNFAAFGINSTGYTGSGAINAPGNAYFLSGSTDLVVGTIGANAIHLVANSNSADSITINSNNAVAFNGNYGITGYLLTSAGTTSAPTWTNPATIGTTPGKLYFYGQF